MKKLLIQPCVLMVASLGLLLTACGGDEQAGGVTVIGEPTVSIEFVGTPGVSPDDSNFSSSFNGNHPLS